MKNKLEITKTEENIMLVTSIILFITNIYLYYHIIINSQFRKKKIMITFNIFSDESYESNDNKYSWFVGEEKVIWLGNNEFRIESDMNSNTINLSFIPENLSEAKKAIKNLLNQRNNFKQLNKNLQTY